MLTLMHCKIKLCKKNLSKKELFRWNEHEYEKIFFNIPVNFRNKEQRIITKRQNLDKKLCHLAFPRERYFGRVVFIFKININNISSPKYHILLIHMYVKDKGM